FRVPITVPEPTDAARTSWPATVGMPFAKGTLARLTDLRLLRADGAALPLQAELFSRWPDGSVKWATLSFLADTATGDSAAYTLEARPNWDSPVPAPGNVLSLSETDNAWRITTDALTFAVGKLSPGLFDHVGFDRNGDGRVTAEECIQTPPMGGNMRLVTGDGQSLGCGPPDPDSFEIEANGPIRAILTWTGPLAGADGAKGWHYRMRITVWRGVPALSVHVAVSNEASDPQYQALKSLALRVPLDGDGVRGAFDDASLETVPDADGLWLHQDKDNHFSMRGAATVSEGKRAAGFAVAEDARTRVTVAFPDFWQTYPSGFAIKPDGIHVQLLPELAPDTYDGDAAWFYKLNAWFRDGNYLFRAGQLTRHHVLVHYAPAGAASPHADTWLANPLLPQASPDYLCATGVLGRPIFARTPGEWDDYEAFFDTGFARNMQDQATRRSYGWMHYGDWYGERYCNYGNNEYDLGWALAVQWMRTGDRRLFDRGLAMAHHHSTVDTLYGPFTGAMRGIVWEHGFNHVGTALTSEELRVPEADADMQKYLESFGRMIRGAMDPQGHIFQEGNWMYAALTGDPWYRDAAERICSHQAAKLTPAFNFSIERSGGWPVINASVAYNFSGNPYYLNAARIMVERCLQRQDPVTGGWLHYPPSGETGGVRVLGGKAFAVGILSNALLRYHDQETLDRPDVRHMLVRGADWLMNEAWIPGKGFRYITNAENHRDIGRRGMTCLLNADLVAFAYEETGDEKYLAFWNEMMLDAFETPPSGMGKAFTQAIRQTVLGLDRVRQWGIVEAPTAEPGS
ncbi:MAG: hypothetical protein GY851_01835, partial [bacterium]|nr:hypothetical protein [bacterium]